MTDTDPRGALAVLAAAVLWGTAGTAAALGPDAATSWQLAALRLVIGGLVLALVGHLLARRVSSRPPPARPFPRVAASIAVLTMASFQASYFIAVGRAGVAIGTAVAIGTVPAATGALQAIVLRTRPERTWWLATSIAVGGLTMLFLVAPAGSDASADPIGVLAGLIAGVSFGGYTVASRAALQAARIPMRTMGALLTGSGVLLAPIAAVTSVGGGWAWLESGTGLATIAWIALAATALSYAAFGRGVVAVVPSTAGTLTLAEPVTAVALGLGLLGERPGPWELLGAGAILGALLLLLANTRARGVRAADPTG